MTQLADLFEANVVEPELVLAAASALSSEEEFATLAALAKESVRRDFHRVDWMAAVLASTPATFRAATAVLRGAAEAFTQCAYCDAPLAMRFMQELNNLYSIAGDIPNVVETHHAIVREAIAARKMIDYPPDGFRIKFSAIRRENGGLRWSYDHDIHNGVTVYPGSNMTLGWGPLKEFLARGIFLTMTDWQLATSYASIARVHEMLGQPLLALEALQEAAALDGAIENWHNLGATLNDIGNLWHRLGVESESYRWYREALAAHRLSGSSSGIANALTNLAQAELDQNSQWFSPLQALQRLVEAAPLHRAAQSRFAVVSQRAMIDALRFVRNDRSPEAAEFLATNEEEINRAAQEANETSPVSAHRLTSILERHNRIPLLTDPAEILQDTYAFIDDVGATAPALAARPADFLQILQRFRTVTECGLRAALSVGDLKTVLDLAERKKNRTILRDLYFNTDAEGQDTRRTLEAEHKSLLGEAEAVDTNPGALRTREQAIRRVLRMTNLQQRLQKSPLVRRAFPPSTMSLYATFRERVPLRDRSAVLLECFSLDGREHLLIAAEDEIAMSTGSGNSLVELREMISALPQKAQAALHAASTVFAVTHGRLHFAPLSILLRGQIVVRSYSLDLLSEAMARPDQGRPTRAVVVDALNSAAARAEARNVMRSLQTYCREVVTIRPNEALRARVCDELATADIVHIISHGEVSPTSPLENALILTDGRLTAAAIGDLRLPRLRFLFLNACWPARSSQRWTNTPDDEFGIVCSFFAAGVSSIIAPVKEVGDVAASGLANEFHIELAVERVVGESSRVLWSSGEIGYALFGNPYVRM